MNFDGEIQYFFAKGILYKVSLFFGTILMSIGIFFVYIDINKDVFFGPMIFLGSIAILYGLKVISVKGIAIDKSNKRYKKYRTFLFIKFGKWKSLEIFDSVVFREYSYVSRKKVQLAKSSIAANKGKIIEYQLYLSGKNKKVLKLITLNEHDELWRVANDLSESLGYELKMAKH